MPHKNDMTAWDEIACQRGCDKHAIRERPIMLGGPTPYRDCTSIPDRFAREFMMLVWDTEQTPVDGGPYCPARDAVSETLLSLGVWEPQETAVLLNCFERVPEKSWFVDFGCQVGWFSTIAALSGQQVLAFDADPECVALTRENLELNGAWGTFTVEQARFDATTDPLDYPKNVSMVAKIDIEGAEHHAIAALQPAIDARKVEFILIEVSPVFHDGYGDLIVGLMEDGFVPYYMPPKHQPPHQIDTLADMERWEMRGDTRAIKFQVDECYQMNLLLALGGVG